MESILEVKIGVEVEVETKYGNSLPFSVLHFSFSFLLFGCREHVLVGNCIRSFYCCKTIKKTINYRIHEK